MSEIAYLEKIEKVLKEADLDCSIVADTEQAPFAHLLVFLGSDAKSRERILRMTAQYQELGQSLKEPASEPTYIRIQFECALPIVCKEHTANEIASLMAFLNRMLELPGFEWDESIAKIYYRLVHVSSVSDVDPMIFVGLVGACTMLLELFSETIESVALGKQSFNDLLEKMLQLSETSGK